MEAQHDKSKISKELSLGTKFKILLMTLVCFTLSVSAQTDQTAPYKGADFSLEGALALFKKAKTVEQFEQSLNEKGNNVNNLDLNNDGKVDYISVNDIKENNAHILVLSTDISKDKTQDIATIDIEKSGDGQANIQIVGDPDLYPANTIVEPTDYNGTIGTSDQSGNNANQGSYNAQNNYNNQNQVSVNVWGWPLIQYMYNPYYSVWNSPYDWYNWPYWYSPWSPFLYSNFYHGLGIYRPYYRISHINRYPHLRNLYSNRRGNIGYRQNFRSQNNFHYNTNRVDRSNTRSGNYIGGRNGNGFRGSGAGMRGGGAIMRGSGGGMSGGMRGSGMSGGMRGGGMSGGGMRGGGGHGGRR